MEIISVFLHNSWMWHKIFLCCSTPHLICNRSLQCLTLSPSPIQWTRVGVVLKTVPVLVVPEECESQVRVLIRKFSFPKLPLSNIYKYFIIVWFIMSLEPIANLRVLTVDVFTLVLRVFLHFVLSNTLIFNFFVFLRTQCNSTTP